LAVAPSVKRFGWRDRCVDLHWSFPLFFTFWAGCSAPRGVPGESVTPPQAFEMWQVAPEEVSILDVRTPAESCSADSRLIEAAVLKGTDR
jgi:hypothetical protein